MKTHWGQFLPFAGRPVESRSKDIGYLYSQKQSLISKLKVLTQEIDNEEQAFEDFIKKEWSSEEILEAKRLYIDSTKIYDNFQDSVLKTLNDQNLHPSSKD